MYLDPDVERFLALVTPKTDEPVPEMTLEQTRAAYSAMMVQFGPEPLPLARDFEIQIPGPSGPVRCRVFVPRESTEPLPVTLFFHGGGCWCLSPDDYAAVCSHFAVDGDTIVVAPDFRLAPENPFPAPLEDSYAAFRWVQTHADEIGGDSERVALVGDSGGGYLVAALAQEAKRHGTPQPSLQVLIYPMLDMAGISYSKVTANVLVTGDSIEQSIKLHSPDDRLDPRASPIHEVDLAGLAPAMIIAAEHDPLIDEGHAYAAKLRTFGVPTTYHLYEGTMHGFVGFGGVISIGNQANRQISAELRHALSRPRDF